VCRQLVSERGEEAQPFKLPVAQCRGYVQALLASNTTALAVTDALNDPRTSELTAYLRHTGVTALLDIPIVTPGSFRGVVCLEVIGGPREWLEEEIDFASDVGAIVALALEAEQRLQAERAARGSDAKYKQLIETLPVTVYSFELRTGQLEYVSPRVEALSGLVPEQLLIEGGIERWVQAVDPAYRHLVRERLGGTLREGFQTELTYPVRLPSGARRWVRDTVGLVQNARGHVFAVQGTLADVTALREAQLERDEIEQRYRTLFEKADFLAVILDREGRIQFANDALARALGVEVGETHGADAFVIGFAQAERSPLRERYLSRLSEGQVAARFETTLTGRSGIPRRILWTNTLIRSNGEVTGMASVGVDITERLQLQGAQHEREKLQSLGRLAAGVAHDFNNLLTIISGCVELIVSNRSAAAAFAEDLNVALTQAAQLTNSLLTYARKESPNPSALRPDDILSRMLPLLTAMTGQGVQLTSQLNAPQAVVTIDASQLRQLLLNLVGNAAEAVRGHGSCVRLTSRLAEIDAVRARVHGLPHGGGFYVITVADDGRGIPDNVLPHIFDAFFTTKQLGTGLGLATCDSVVRRAGGFMTVTSVPLEGTTFEAFLPAAEP
jgi:PAS domain S-box-containing protein